MKKVMALLLAVMMTLSLVACGGNKTGDVENIMVDGQEVAMIDFLVEHLKEYRNSEEITSREQEFMAISGEAEPRGLTVTRVIEVKADNLGQDSISVHFLAVKADCGLAVENGAKTDILIVVDYDTGDVYSEFDADESVLQSNDTKAHEVFYMLNGPLCGVGYESGVIIVDSETRIELSKNDVAAINAALNG